MNLRDMKAGQRGHIESMEGPIDRLWERGLRPGQTIEMVDSSGNHCIFKLKGSTLAIDSSGIEILVQLDKLI